MEFIHFAFSSKIAKIEMDFASYPYKTSYTSVMSIFANGIYTFTGGIASLRLELVSIEKRVYTYPYRYHTQV